MALQIRRGTDADWESTNQNIVAGEPAIALDTGRFFVGTDNGEFAEFANVENYYDKDAVDDIEDALQDSIDAKADASSTYTKTQVDSALALKADKAELDEISSVAMVENSASGQVVSFEDGSGLPFTDLLIGINAEQDLHGYDAPWVGGAGKNKAELVDPQLTTNVSQRVATLNYTGTFDITISFDLVGAKYTASGASLFNFVYNEASHYVVPTSVYKIDNSTTIQLNTEYTGRFYHKWTNVENPQYINMYFESASYGKWSGQMKNIQVEIGSTATAYAPYSNICPIIGKTGDKVYRTGKNLVSPLVYNGGSYNPSIGATLNFTVAGDSKQFTANQDRTVFTVSTTSNNQTFTILYPVKHGYPVYNNIALSGESLLRTSRLHLDKDFKVLSRVNNTSKTQSVLGVMTPSENDAYYAIVITNSTATSETITMTNPMACFGNADAPYEPYVGNVYPISWQSEAGTVYGGTLGVTTGVLTVTHGIVDLGTLTWSKSEYRFLSDSLVSVAKAPSANNIVADILCEVFATRSADETYLKYNGIGLGRTGRLSAYDTSLEESDVSAFLSAVNGKMLVYPLATPQTYQLTPVEVQTLLGANNIWADCGDVENITYKADTKLYIDNAVGGVDELLGSGVIE